ncbi:MAG: T9SS type A sorting domain-containing protein, partial [Bacteroidales bacterium]|nr:T9SS type A sorting domain-containing protein [Bacteroidales bacterium]
QTFQNALGCDSVVTLHLTINASETYELAATACDSYIWNDAIYTESGDYVQTFQNALGCDSVVTLHLTINALPDVAIEGVTEICFGETTTLTATTAISYLWSNGATTQSIEVSEAGDYTVTITDINGCSNNATATVTVNPLPEVSITGSTTICYGSSTVLTATEGISYYWNNGAVTRSITVVEGGEYSVIVTDANGCSNSATVTVIVNPLPEVAIEGETAICFGETTTLTATAAVSYLWSNGATTQSIVVSEAGNYTVTVTDVNGCSNSATAVVIVNPLPTVTIAGITDICEGSTTTLTATPSAAYLWSTGATTQSITVSESGIYSVVVTNNNGCSNSAEVTVTVHALPEVSISGNTTICNNESTVLTSTPGSSYHWSNGATTQSITVSNAGTYAVSVTNENGCIGNASVTVVVNPIYYQEFSATVCQGTPYSGHGFNVGTPVAGSFEYINDMQTVNGCDSITVLNLTVIALPEVTILGDFEICSGESTVLTANVANGMTYTYLWNTGATSATIMVAPATTQNYSVTVNNAYGCSSSAEALVMVNPLPNITISGETLICQGESTTLTASGAGANGTYEWSNGQTTAAITVSPSYTSVYTVVVTTENGCVSSEDVVVSVQDAPAPRYLVAFGINNHIVLNWNGNADSYNIYRNDELIGSTSFNDYEDEDIDLNTTYCYYVIGIYGETMCESEPSNTACASNTSTLEVEAEAINVYPNPADQFITVDGNNMNIVEMYNSLGQRVVSKAVENSDASTLRIETQNFETGMYIIRIKTNDGSIINKRVIIAR